MALEVDGAGEVGAFTSIAIGTVGFPVISCRDTSSVDLTVARCRNPGCRS